MSVYHISDVNLEVMVVSGIDQDKLELELVLKGSYEDTQTAALDTASAFCFHYMAAQEAELSGRLRVGVTSGPLPPTPGWANSSSCGPLPGPPPAKARPLWPCQSPPVWHCALGR